MENYIKYQDQINSLITFVKSRNIDISTQEKFSEAMKNWYKCQVSLSKNISEMDFSVLKNIITK